ncbi:hypothetical protein H310_02259 [Aphanomyces invadans]|uniref:Uncharacterized protein n=1 Tax=Aphanomyces invadans TaxID=157072 RepID=A0A024UN18_9STRA|nr:hypothetical protein H310_02259 [Aphanomyces invadans]ETW07836.1 hypothetical protein H310_02259 [Aphanomyces invadans]|eukprot:XP_008863929.1 hypothetical protein H310_02259 [Aphanomyces invadans]
MGRAVVKMHQIGMAVAGLLCTIAAVWAFVGDKYHDSYQNSVARVSLRVFQIALSLVLLMTAGFGMKQPLKWFGLLDSFVGSGLFAIFLGFFTLHLDNDYGLYSTIVIMVVGVLSILYGMFVKDERHDYPPLMA